VLVDVAVTMDVEDTEFVNVGDPVAVEDNELTDDTVALKDAVLEEVLEGVDIAVLDSVAVLVAVVVGVEDAVEEHVTVEGGEGVEDDEAVLVGVGS
jgi:hypothetical protein